MKKYHFLFLPFLLFLVSVLSESCDRNKCENVICGLRQSCVNGICQCAPGYEGDNCETLARDKFLGQYLVSTSCVQGFAPAQYPTQVIEDFNEINKIQITNIVGTGLSAEAYIDRDLIEIPDQNIGAGTIFGQGNYDQILQRIIIEYNYSVNGQLSNCTATFFPQ